MDSIDKLKVIIEQESLVEAEQNSSEVPKADNNMQLPEIQTEGLTVDVNPAEPETAKKKPKSKIGIVIAAVAVVIAIIAGVVILSGHGSSSQYVGEWKADKVEFDTNTIIDADENGMSLTLMLYDDNSAHMIYNSATGDGNWKENGKEATLTVDQTNLRMWLSEEKLYLELNNGNAHAIYHMEKVGQVQSKHDKSNTSDQEQSKQDIYDIIGSYYCYDDNTYYDYGDFVGGSPDYSQMELLVEKEHVTFDYYGKTYKAAIYGADLGDSYDYAVYWDNEPYLMKGGYITNTVINKTDRGIVIKIQFDYDGNNVYTDFYFTK